MTYSHYKGLSFLGFLAFLVHVPLSPTKLDLDLVPAAFSCRHLEPSAEDRLCINSSHHLAGINYLAH